jgi:hypothetical protein
MKSPKLSFAYLKSTSVRKLTRLKSRAFPLLAPLKYAGRKNRFMKIEVITMMYNEAALASLFVQHYAPWVDKFTVFYSESVDDTRRELETAAARCGVSSLDIVPFEFLGGFDDDRKIARINETVWKSSASFAVCVDADEFVHPWPFEGVNPRDALAKETGDVVCCKMFDVYRHATDADIDPTKPPLFQRRHGHPEVHKHYVKPCIVRPDCGAQFARGCHALLAPKQLSSTIWRGVHWGKADNFCLMRYMRDRRDRLSHNARRRNWGVRHSSMTDEQLIAELKAHENDPQLF